jgi:hypothetical protein
LKSAAFRRALILITLGIAAAVPSLARTSDSARIETSTYEYDVKAVFLYHFTRYLQWPEKVDPGEFTIVVFGESGIIAPLQEIARKKSVGSSPIVVRQCSEIGQIGRPRILFIARSAAPGIARVLELTRGTDILTVGEEEGLGARGVAVNFVNRDGTVKFEMCEKTLKEAGIQVSSQLLKLAILVGDKKAGGGQ